MNVGLLLLKVLVRPVQWVVRQPASRLYVTGGVLVFLAYGFYVAIMALNHTLLFDGFAANGAFQLMNPLRRLAAGEVIGSDFNFFHGIGVPLIHLPFYYLFGQGLFGSEMARWVVSPSLFIAAAFAFFYVLRRSLVYAFSMTAAVTFAAMQVIPFLVLPLTSLLGVRSVVPVFLMVLMLKQQRLRRPLVNHRYPWLSSITWYELLAAVLLAVGFICGTEFGIAAILGFMIANTLYAAETNTALTHRLYSSLRVLGMLAGAVLALYTAITRGAPLQPLRFALSELPADQFWYFGVPPNKFLHTENVVFELTHDGGLLLMLGIALLAGGLVYALHRLRVSGYRVYVQAFSFGLLAGMFAMVSMLGYYDNSEASALTRMALLVSGAALTLLYPLWRRPLRMGVELGRLKRRLNLTPPAALKMLGVLAVVVVAWNGIHIVRLTTAVYDVPAALAHAKYYVKGTDTDILGREWRQVTEDVMSVIQADNTVAVADVNDSGYLHGIHPAAREVVIEAGDKASFIRPGQVVYFSKSGRQIIRSVYDRGNGQQVARLESELVQLDPAYDGAPRTLIVGERFDHDSKRVWSMYGGLLEEEMGVSHPTPQGYDYIIHALGEERRAEYVEEFKRTQPKFVLAFNRTYFRYEDWMRGTHWELYSLLDTNYEVVRQTTIYNVWQRRDQPWSDKHAQPVPWQPLAIDTTARKIPLPNLDFTSVPDLEMYGRGVQQAEQDALRARGIAVKDEPFVTDDQYDAYKALEARARRHYYLWRNENSGRETDRREHQEWLKAARSKKEAFDVGAPSPGGLHINRPKRQVILVRLTYELSQPLESLPLLGKTARYLVEPNNTYTRTPIPLRPYENEVTFPLIISEHNKDAYLRLAGYALLPGGAELHVTSAAWTTLETTPPNLRALTD